MVYTVLYSVVRSSGGSEQLLFSALFLLLLFFFSKCHLSAAWCLQQIHSLNIQLFSALIKDT